MATVAFKFNPFTGTFDMVQGEGPFTSGSVLFAGSDGSISEDNSNFFWNDTNNYAFSKKFLAGSDATFSNDFTVRISETRTSEMPAGATNGFYLTESLAPTAPSSNPHYGMKVEAGVVSGNTHDITEIGGLFFQVAPDGTGEVGAVYGCNGYVAPFSDTTVPGIVCFNSNIFSLGSEVNITGGYGFLASVVGFGQPITFNQYISFGASIIAISDLEFQTLKGVDIPAPASVGGTITINGSYIGLDIEDASGLSGTYTTYNIISEGATNINYFEGYVGCGTIAPDHKLHVSSGSAVGIRVDGSGNTATTATAGSQTLPANPQGFLIINIAGTDFKIGYYNA